MYRPKMSDKIFRSSNGSDGGIEADEILHLDRRLHFDSEQDVKSPPRRNEAEIIFHEELDAVPDVTGLITYLCNALIGLIDGTTSWS